jgi:hypothetical protein
MQTVKKTVVLLFIAVFGAMLANVPAGAQEPSLSVNVPFDFVVGQNTLGAGAYRVERQGDFLSIRGDQGRTLYVLLLAGGAAKEQTGSPYLVFTRTGGEAFLSSVVFSEDRAYDLPQSGKERELNSKATREQVAVHMQ